MTNWPPRAVTGVDTLGETPVILEEGGDGIIDLWVKIQDNVEGKYKDKDPQQPA